MKPMNPLTGKRIFLNCSPQCLFAVHHGNSLVYAFTEVSIEQTMKQDNFYILYAKFLSIPSNKQVCAGLNLFG